MTEKIRLLIADDHALVRQGLRAVLDTEPDIEIVGEAGDGHEAAALAEELLPDVALMDIKMMDGDGLAATRRMRATTPSVKVIVLTNYGEDELVFSAMRAGASGYLLKDVRPDALASAVRTVAQGYALVYPSVARRLLEELGPHEPAGSDGALAELTVRERQILKLIAQGRSNKQIATALGIAERTVKAHVSNILAKLELSDRTQAAIYAHQRGLG